MAEDYRHLSIEGLQEILVKYKRNYEMVLSKIATHAGSEPIHLLSSAEDFKSKIDIIESEIVRRSKINPLMDSNINAIKNNKLYFLLFIFIFIIIILLITVILYYTNNIFDKKSIITTPTLDQAITPTNINSQSFRRIKPDPLSELYDDEVLGKVQQYKHDITGIVQYNRVSVDDDIAKVEVICSNKVTDVTSKFSRIVPPPEDDFPNYGSQPIEIPKTCSIIFTVRDLKGNSTGLTLYGTIK